jgi:hypothetical protein
MSTKPPKIFISHIYEEKDVAAAVQKYIENILGGEVEIFRSSDRWKLRAGEPWLDRIRKELQESKIFILMLSAESVKRPWVNFEAGAAWVSPNKLVIPVCFSGLTKGTMPLPYSTLSAIDLKQDYVHIISAICGYLGKLTPPQRLPHKDTPAGMLLDRIASFEQSHREQSPT